MGTKVNRTKDCSHGRRGDGSETEIAYSIVDSALGRLLVAGTQRGICFAAMGKSDRRLVTELRADYPRASIRIADSNRWRSDSTVAKWAHAIARLHSRPLGDADAADGYTRHAISMFGVGPTPRDPSGPNALIHGNRATNRPAARRPRGRYRQRRKSGLDCHPMSSGNPRIGASRRLPMGSGTQAQVAGDGSRPATSPLTSFQLERIEPRRARRGFQDVPWIGEAQREKTVSEIFSSEGMNSAA